MAPGRQSPRRHSPAKAGAAGDRVLCYHGKPEHALYAIAEVTRNPYPDPHDSEAKRQVIDLRAIERLPRQVSLKDFARIACSRN